MLALNQDRVENLKLITYPERNNSAHRHIICHTGTGMPADEFREFESRVLSHRISVDRLFNKQVLAFAVCSHAQNNDGQCLHNGEGVAMNKSLTANDYKLSADHENAKDRTSMLNA
jgi:TPR repeat protein